MLHNNGAKLDLTCVLITTGKTMVLDKPVSSAATLGGGMVAVMYDFLDSQEQRETCLGESILQAVHPAKETNDARSPWMGVPSPDPCRCTPCQINQDSPTSMGPTSQHHDM